VIKRASRVATLKCRPSLARRKTTRRAAGPREGSEKAIGNESVPIQLAQCRFPGLAISSAKILIYIFSNKIYRSNFIKQHSETFVA